MKLLLPREVRKTGTTGRELLQDAGGGLDSGQGSATGTTVQKE